MLTRNDFSKTMTSSFIQTKKASIVNSYKNSPKKSIGTAIPIIKRIKLVKAVIKSKSLSRPELIVK